MTHLRNELELFRGQIEELQGRMQQTVGRLAGPAGAVDMIRGRALEMRGKARQAMAITRMRAQELTETIRERPGMLAPPAALLIAGIAIAALAIYSPHTLARAWESLRRPVMQIVGTGRETVTGQMA